MYLFSRSFSPSKCPPLSLHPSGHFYRYYLVTCVSSFLYRFPNSPPLPLIFVPKIANPPLVVAYLLRAVQVLCQLLCIVAAAVSFPSDQIFGKTLVRSFVHDLVHFISILSNVVILSCCWVLRRYEQRNMKDRIYAHSRRQVQFIVIEVEFSFDCKGSQLQVVELGRFLFSSNIESLLTWGPPSQVYSLSFR